ncbi:MAG: tRNA (N(6)-L-threonylcarbamoyladenosine(37)-C(2))-methylthiotransferase MtaB [Clostridia bacterium]|nr:tRNA (N(6)-L-threonylcarbamoyladenosine(37)-C(2))-methylthiotransferase MtaB [Clostridia bacterium]
MTKIGILTLGCRVNQYESQAISEQLKKRGYLIAPFQDDCDVYIINTCTVTSSSDKKSRQMIGRAIAKKKANNDIIVCAIGCFTQNRFQNNKNIPMFTSGDIDFIGGNTDKSKIPELLDRYIKSHSKEKLSVLKDIEKEKDFDDLTLSKSTNTRAYLKVQDGCNNFCTYCIVPIVRGPVRSKPIEKVKEDLINLKNGGYNEVVFCGIEISAYGNDNGESLVSLAKLAKETGFARVRYGSLNPTLLNEHFIKQLSEFDVVMPHFHLSVQSASDTVLAAMGRQYTQNTLQHGINLLHKYFENVTLSCDIICGFPGETEDDFNETVKFISENEITHAHIFPYSKRDGTPAACAPNQVSQNTKKQRCTLLQNVATSKVNEVFRKYTGETFNVLIENKKGGYYLGHTENFLPVALSRRCEVGTFEKVTLSDVFEKVSDEISFITC